MVWYEIDGVETSPAQSEREQMHKLNPNTHVATRGDNAPYFKHDCDTCRFRGSLVEIDVDGSSQVVDVYTCDNDSGTVVRRFSSDGPDYASFPRSVVDHIVSVEPTSSWVATLKLVLAAEAS